MSALILLQKQKHFDTYQNSSDLYPHLVNYMVLLKFTFSRSRTHRIPASLLTSTPICVYKYMYICTPCICEWTKIDVTFLRILLWQQWRWPLSLALFSEEFQFAQLLLSPTWLFVQSHPERSEAAENKNTRLFSVGTYHEPVFLSHPTEDKAQGSRTPFTAAINKLLTLWCSGRKRPPDGTKNIRNGNSESWLKIARFLVTE